MKLTKEALLTHKLLGRNTGYLDGILIQPDGSTVATDGHKLVRYTPAQTTDEDPASRNHAELEPFILATTDAKQTATMLKKGFEAIVDVEATNANGTASIRVKGEREIDPKCGTFLQPTKVEGSFPKYEAVIPKADTAGETVLLSVPYMAQIFTMLKQQGFDDATVKIQTPKNGDCDKPVIINAKNDAGKSLVIVMPIHRK